MLTAVAAVGLLMLTACSSTDAGESPELSDLFATDDQQREVAECMRDRGWNAEFDEETGAIVTSVDDSQRSVYDTDTAECSEIAGINIEGGLTAEQFPVVFDWYREIGGCLEDAGWSVPDEPTFQTFQSTYDSNPWIPWAEVPGNEMNEAREACPILKTPR